MGHNRVWFVLDTICVASVYCEYSLLPDDAEVYSEGLRALGIGALAGTSPVCPSPLVRRSHTSSAPLAPPALAHASLSPLAVVWWGRGGRTGWPDVATCYES
jgi:hypothetical protein